MGGKKRGITSSFFTSTPKKPTTEKDYGESTENVKKTSGEGTSTVPAAPVAGGSEARGNAHAPKPAPSAPMHADLNELTDMLVRKLRPEIDTLIKDAVENLVLKTVTEQIEPTKSLVRLNYYKGDRNEQYTRRETVKVCGMAESAQESQELLGTKLVSLFNDIGVAVDRQDISVFHRNGPAKPGKPRPILCRFVSRQKRDEVLANKKKLKDIPALKSISIFEDLTPLRSRLLGLVKSMENVDYAYTVNGKIVACLKQAGSAAKDKANQKKVYIESPDDLFKLGVKEIPFDKLNIRELDI